MGITEPIPALCWGCCDGETEAQGRNTSYLTDKLLPEQQEGLKCPEVWPSMKPPKHGISPVGLFPSSAARVPSLSNPVEL